MIPKILFIQDNNAPVVYYRMYGFAQKMGELGLAHCRMFPPWNDKAMTQTWEDNIKDHLPTLREMVAWADIVIAQYVGTMTGFTMIETTKEFKPVLMETDDWFKAVPGYSGAFGTNRPGEQQDFWGTRQMEVSSGVVCATEYLAKLVSQHNRNVTTIPNCIDFDLWDKFQGKPHDLIRIGWIGGADHVGDLKLVKEVLYEILEKYKNVEVYFVNCLPSWEHHERLLMIDKCVPIMEYPHFVKGYSFDIGIAPLRDNYFNRAKSNLRYLEYSACHIPTVASDVEPFKHNFKGFRATTGEQWLKHLSLLIEDRDVRHDVGEAAYIDVKDKFSLERGSRIYADHIGKVLNAVDSGNRSERNVEQDRA